MKKPEDYDLKKDLCQDDIKSITVHHYQTGVDTDDTDLEVGFIGGTKIRGKARRISPLLDLRVSWCSIAEVKSHIRREVEQWDEYADKEAEELEEYTRLKEKFEN